MRIKLLSLMLCMTLMFSISGCSSDKMGSSSEDDALETTKWDDTLDNSNKDNVNKNDDKDNIKNDKSRSSKKNRDSRNDSEDIDKITYTYRNNPVEGSYGKDIYALGNYCTIELDEEIRDKYPELSNVADRFNSDMEKEIMDFVRGSDADVLEMWEEGFLGYYEEDRLFHPVRADGKVFSFFTENYSFYGGAHGTTSFTGYNYDPETGEEISFDDVIKDTDNLPEIIFDELTAQNGDLKDYFDELPSDKENLMNSIPGRLENNADGLSWALDYDGIRFNFEDYAMGSYAIGSQTVKISFSDYPEIFTDSYTDYEESRRVPDIEEIAVKLEDAGTIEIGDVSSAGNSEDRTSTDNNRDKEVPDLPKGHIINISKDDQNKMNLFVSNFAEQGFREYDDEYPDVSVLTEYAYIWSRINKRSNIEIENSYYKIGFDKIKEIVDKYFGLRLTNDDFYEYNWAKSRSGGFCKNGYFYVPAADGESYPAFAVVEQAEDSGNGILWLYFTTYEVSLDTYWDSGDSVPKKYYSLSAKEASEAPYLTKGYQGLAIVRKDGESYKLKYYKLY